MTCTDGKNWSRIDDEKWFSHMSNETNFWVHEDLGSYIMCGNNTGAGKCPLGTVCMAVRQFMFVHIYEFSNYF